MFLRKRISNTLKHNCNSHWNWHFWDLLSKESISALKSAMSAIFPIKWIASNGTIDELFLNEVCNKSNWKDIFVQLRNAVLNFLTIFYLIFWISLYNMSLSFTDGHTIEKMRVVWKKGFDQSKVTDNNYISLTQFEYAVFFEENYEEEIASGKSIAYQRMIKWWYDVKHFFYSSPKH